jgi:hypothetical protein
VTGIRSIYSETKLENVTVISTNNTTGTTRYNHAISVQNNNSVSLKNITVTSDSTNPGYQGSLIGINLYDNTTNPGRVQIEDVDVTADSALSIALYGPDLYVTDMTTAGSSGISGYVSPDSDVHVNNSDLSSLYLIAGNFGSGGDGYVNNSRIRGTIDKGDGASNGPISLKCNNVVDDLYDPVVCP